MFAWPHTMVLAWPHTIVVACAVAAAWTAARIADGAAQALPEEPELDPRGLRMEMVF